MIKINYSVTKPVILDIPPPPPAFVNNFSMLMDGVNELIKIGNIAELNFDGSTPFSILIWVKISVSATAGTLFSKILGASPFTGWFIDHSGGEIRVKLINTIATNNISIITTGVNINNGNWQLVIVTYDGTKNASGVKVSIDGAAASVSIVEDNLTGSIANAGKACISGRNQVATAGSLIKGGADEAVAYNTELTSSAIATLYNSGVPIDVLTDVGNYTNSANVVWGGRMGDGAVFNVSFWDMPDISGNGNNSLTLSMEEADRVTDVPS